MIWLNKVKGGGSGQGMLGSAVSGVKGHDKDRYEKYDEDYGPDGRNSGGSRRLPLGKSR